MCPQARHVSSCTIHWIWLVQKYLSAICRLVQEYLCAFAQAKWRNLCRPLRTRHHGGWRRNRRTAGGWLASRGSGRRTPIVGCGRQRHQCDLYSGESRLSGRLYDDGRCGEVRGSHTSRIKVIGDGLWCRLFPIVIWCAVIYWLRFVLSQNNHIFCTIPKKTDYVNWCNKTEIMIKLKKEHCFCHITRTQSKSLKLKIENIISWPSIMPSSFSKRRKSEPFGTT